MIRSILALSLLVVASPLARAEDAPAPATAATPAPAPAASPAAAPDASPAASPEAAAPAASPEAAAPTAAAPAAAPAATLTPLDPPTEARFQIGAFIGSQGAHSSSFNPRGGSATVGLTGRATLRRALDLHVGLVHSASGGTRYFESTDDVVYDEYGYAYEDTTSLEASTTLTTERVEAGLTAYAPWEWFQPFARVDGVAAVAVARMDEDTEDPENPTQLTRVGVTGGVYVGGGFATPIRIKHQVHLVPALEAGYTALAPLTLGDIGSLRRSGYTVRFSTSVAF